MTPTPRDVEQAREVDEAIAYEILRVLEWDDLVSPFRGIPRIVERLQKVRAQAREAGRREGIEEAAEMVEAMLAETIVRAHEDTLLTVATDIRALLEPRVSDE